MMRVVHLINKMEMFSKTWLEGMLQERCCSFAWFCLGLSFDATSKDGKGRRWMEFLPTYHNLKG